jgi:hypothetical protein
MRQVLIFFSLALFSFPLLAGRDVSAVRYAPSDLSAANPAIASNGNRFLTLWPMSGQIFGSLSDIAGSNSPAFAVVPFANASGVLVIGTGSGYVAIWNERDNVPVFGRLTSEGVLERRVPLARTRFFGAALAFNGSQIAIVDTTSFQGLTIDISIYDLDGNLVRRSPVTAYNGERWAVTANGGDFAVVTAGATGINEWRVTNDGAVHPAVRIQPPTTDPLKSFYSVAAGARNGRIVAGWLQAQAGVPSSATIQPDGTVTQSPLPNGGVPPSGSIAVLPVDTGFVVTWNVIPSAPDKPGMFALRLDGTGALIESQPYFLGDGQFAGAAPSGNTIALALNTQMFAPPYRVLTVTATVNDTGIAAHAATTVLSPVRQFGPAVTGNGAGFTAAWLEQDGGGKRIVAGRINPAGEPLDGTGIPLDLRASAAPVIAHGPSEELIVWTGNGRLVASRLSPFSGLLDATPIDIAPLAFGSYDVVWNGSRFFVVWTDGSRFFGAFVGSDGVATSPRDLGVQISSVDTSSASALDVAWDGRQFIVVYAETSPLFCTCIASPDRVRVLRISTAGVAIDVVPVLIPGKHFAAHVASSGSESLIVLDRAGGASSVVVRDESGTLHLDPEVPVFDWFVGTSGVAWDGSSYVVAVRYAASPAFETEAGWLAAVQVSESGIPLRTVITPAAGPPDFSFATAPSVATDVAGGTAFVISEVTSPTFVARARLYLLSEFSPTPMPAPPPAPRNAVSYFGGTTTRIDWQSDGGGSGFLIERSTDFGKNWSPYAVLPADARTTTVTAKIGDLFRVRAFGPGGLSEGTITSIGSPQRRHVAH